MLVATLFISYRGHENDFALLYVFRSLTGRERKAISRLKYIATGFRASAIIFLPIKMPGWFARVQRRY